MHNKMHTKLHSESTLQTTPSDYVWHTTSFVMIKINFALYSLVLEWD
jgi:hypothetical protein